ncbi:MAG: cobalamin-dependent protein [Chitinophagales bacterium]|nr:cobalamin-dependent protein [Chitinophagales bacterium]
MSFSLQYKVRIVTAASLFDGHDAAINIMRRIMQAKGAEVIHLGHNRSAQEIVEAAIQEDAQGIAVTSYQGGHIEFFKYMYDLLKERGCGHIKIFGGGGGTILPHEIEELHTYGISRIYSPDDGRRMGLDGMIEDVLQKCDFDTTAGADYQKLTEGLSTQAWRNIAQLITLAERGHSIALNTRSGAPVLGITGTGGAGKSSVTDEIVRRFLYHFPDKTVAVISVDPSKKKTGGALLGDRIRMNSIFNPRAYMRSLATRESDRALSKHVREAIEICKAAGFDFIILESAGVGQSDTSILDFCHVSLYVMTPEYGAASQLEKINMLDFADAIAINKFDKAGALDAYHDVCKQYKRNHQLFNVENNQLPVIGTIASKFNDAGINRLFEVLLHAIQKKTGAVFGQLKPAARGTDLTQAIIPPSRVRYLAEIAETIEQYDRWVEEQSDIARKLYQLKGTINIIENKLE